MRKRIGKIVLGVTSGKSIPLLGKLPMELVNAGWEVTVVSNSDCHLQSTRIPNLKYHTIEMLREPALCHDIFGLMSWLKFLKRIRPDVVASGTPKAGLLGLLSASVMRIPRRVYVLRGLPLETAPKSMAPILWFAEFMTALASTQILAASRSLADAYVRLHLAKPEKIKVLGAGSLKGVDLVYFQEGVSRKDLLELKGSLGLDENLPIVGFVGRVREDKGIFDLIAAREILTQNGVPIQLLLVGSIEDHSSSLSSLLDGDPSITVVDQVSDVRRYLRILDVLCLPTWREGFPNIVLEAMASEVPVVTTTATGAIDAVDHGVTGLTVPKQNPQELALALRQVLEDQNLRESLKRNALKRVKASFLEADIMKMQVAFFENSP